MLTKFCMTLLAAGALALPALADDDDRDEDEENERRGSRVSVCHRTSSKAVQGFYPGQVVSIRSRDTAAHLRHRDVLLNEAAMRLLAQTVSRGSGDGDDEDEDEGEGRRRVMCRLDASANVFDVNGRLVQGKLVKTDQWGDGKRKPKGGPG